MNIPNVILFKDLIKQFPDHNEPSILEGETFFVYTFRWETCMYPSS